MHDSPLAAEAGGGANASAEITATAPTAGRQASTRQAVPIRMALNIPARGGLPGDTGEWRERGGVFGPKPDPSPAVAGDPWGCRPRVPVRRSPQATAREGRDMGTSTAGSGGPPDPKARQRAVWSLGDFHRVAKDVVWGLGPVLVDACAIGPGQRVLDVGAGTGNVAIRAAEAGADAVASDLTPELFDAGRREAREHGVTVEWVEADAEALPFADGEFDVAVSAIGAMFAPDHAATARELVRVCRPGGRIGMINWTPEGAIGAMFRLFASYGPPPPPGATPPTLWGDEAHVRELLGGHVESLEMSRRELLVDHFADPAAACAHAKEHFGPTIAAFAALADEPARSAALDRDFLSFTTDWNRGSPGEGARYHYEYLLVVADLPGG